MRTDADSIAPERVTEPDDQNDQLLYFTSSSLTSDDGTLLFISDRTGYPLPFTACSA